MGRNTLTHLLGSENMWGDFVASCDVKKLLFSQVQEFQKHI